ncbi:hypothetical protein RJ640_030317 [Escallonia rubra]|uniref:FBD domain-containing protein n=1 Tax=Escallonia rubra TaxID=112253 RepID=A0AA88R220_9ASTE|nr:hypothetical protein RJ640_030317 [Escallonia rubra]
MAGGQRQNFKGCQLGIGRGVQKATKYLHQQLLVMELAGFVGHSFEFELVFYLLENAVMLEKVIVDPRNYYMIGTPCEFKETKEKQEARKRARKLERRLLPNAKLIILYNLI